MQLDAVEFDFACSVQEIEVCIRWSLTSTQDINNEELRIDQLVCFKEPEPQSFQYIFKHML